PVPITQVDATLVSSAGDAAPAKPVERSTIKPVANVVVGMAARKPTTSIAPTRAKFRDGRVIEPAPVAPTLVVGKTPVVMLWGTRPFPLGAWPKGAAPTGFMSPLYKTVENVPEVQLKKDDQRDDDLKTLVAKVDAANEKEHDGFVRQLQKD